MRKKMQSAKSALEIILVLEDDVLVRTALSQYLRHCGYRVIETACEDEAMQVFTKTDISINILFCATPAFTLMQWMRINRPDVQVVIAGSISKAAHAAGDLCEKGPHLKKPYEPQQVIDWIKRLKASGQPTPMCMLTPGPFKIAVE
jgi:DNA-binding response OmpR family regulator